jgi:hypothetical protein
MLRSIRPKRATATPVLETGPRDLPGMLNSVQLAGLPGRFHPRRTMWYHISTLLLFR